MRYYPILFSMLILTINSNAQLGFNLNYKTLTYSVLELINNEWKEDIHQFRHMSNKEKISELRFGRVRTFFQNDQIVKAFLRKKAWQSENAFYLNEQNGDSSFSILLRVNENIPILRFKTGAKEDWEFNIKKLYVRSEKYNAEMSTYWETFPSKIKYHVVKDTLVNGISYLKISHSYEQKVISKKNNMSKNIHLFLKLEGFSLYEKQRQILYFEHSDFWQLESKNESDLEKQISNFRKNENIKPIYINEKRLIAYE